MGRGAGTRARPGVTCTLTFRWYAENAPGALGRLPGWGVLLRYSYIGRWLVMADFPGHNVAGPPVTLRAAARHGVIVPGHGRPERRRRPPPGRDNGRRAVPGGSSCPARRRAGCRWG